MIAMNRRLQALELFSGIGGFATAVNGYDIRVVTAVDQSTVAAAVYRLNFPGHAIRSIDLERVSQEELTATGANLWWLSPPCQPYSTRGRRRDVNDPRARSLLHLVALLARVPADRLPNCLAVENVPGFAHSQARSILTDMLNRRGYQFREQILCPTQLGVPMRRPRYYLIASQTLLAPLRQPIYRKRPLHEFLDAALDKNPSAELLVPSELIARFGSGMRILDPDHHDAYTTCFTGGYGKSLMHAGSYLRCSSGVRRFAPEEIARLLGFPQNFRFPGQLPLRKRWQLLGNSLSVDVVRDIIEAIAQPFRVQPDQAATGCKLSHPPAHCRVVHS